MFQQLSATFISISTLLLLMKVAESKILLLMMVAESYQCLKLFSTLASVNKSDHLMSQWYNTEMHGFLYSTPFQSSPAGMFADLMEAQERGVMFAFEEQIRKYHKEHDSNGDGLLNTVSMS